MAEYITPEITFIIGSDILTTSSGYGDEYGGSDTPLVDW